MKPRGNPRSFVALFFLIQTLLACVCHGNEPNPLYRLWSLQKTEQNQKIFLSDLLGTLERCSSKEGEVTALFIEALIRDERILTPWIRDYVKSFFGKSKELDQWIYGLLIASRESKTVGDTMLMYEILEPPNSSPLVIAPQKLNPRKAVLDLRSQIFRKGPTHMLYRDEIFPKMADEAQVLDLIFDLGDSSWEVRQKALDTLSQIPNLNVRFLFDEMEHETDPEVKQSLSALFEARIPPLFELFKLGSLERLPKEDKIFIWRQMIHPYILHSWNLNLSLTYDLIPKIKELVIGEEELAREIFRYFSQVWTEISLFNDFDIVSDILFSLAYRFPLLRDETLSLFENLYERPGAEGFYDYLTEHRIPTFMSLLSVDSLKLSALVLNPSLLDIKRKLYVNLLMRQSTQDPVVWQFIFKRLMSDDTARPLKLDMINLLYFRGNSKEVKEILTTLTGSSDFLIASTAFKNILDLCDNTEAVQSSYDLMLKLLSQSKNDPSKIDRIFGLAEDSYICPVAQDMTQLLNHPSTHVRYVAFKFVLAQYGKFSRTRERFDVIQNYLLSESNEDTHHLMVEVLLNERWLNINPARYKCLFEYLEQHPTGPMKERIEKFLLPLMKQAV